MSIAFKGTVVYKDETERDAENPLTFEEMMSLLNDGKTKFEFGYTKDDSNNEEPKLTITKK